MEKKIKKAIERFQGWLTEGYYKINRQDTDWSEDKEALELAIQCMKDKRPKGEWVMIRPYKYKCGICGCETSEEEGLYNFCPDCGADMKGGKEE